MNKQPWMGFFAAYESKRFNFAISSQGKVTLTPMNEKGKPVSSRNEIRIAFGIEEVLPNGKTTTKEIKVESLESAEAATDKLQKTVIRGKVAGDAAFEAFIEQDRGIISMGGHVTDTGTLTKNPIRFTIRATIPDVYEKVEKNGEKALKAFEKRIKDDSLDLEWTDGKRLKEALDKPVDVNSKEINGPGITDLELELSAYGGSKIYCSASENSAITLSGKAAPSPLNGGFTIRWLADAAKDPQGKARLKLLVK